MKRKYVWIPCLILLITGVSCKIIAYRSYAKKFSISYGSGGGFTGAVDEYLLNGDGRLQQIKSLSKDTVLLKTIAKQDLKKIIKLAESKPIQSTVLDEASNMNSFIRIYKNGSLVKSFQWQKGKMDLPTDLSNLNNLLKQLTSI